MTEEVAMALPPIEASLVFATLLVSYDSFKPDLAQIGRLGYPAFYERSAKPRSGSGSGSGNVKGLAPEHEGVVMNEVLEEEEEGEEEEVQPTKSKFSFFGKKKRDSKVKLAKRRLQVQFPRRVLTDPRCVIEQTPLKTAEDIKRSRGDPNRKYLTVWDSERLELVGIRDRDPLCRVATTLFCGNGINNPRLFYPSESVVAGTKWSSKYRADSVTAPVKWATLSILTPPQDGKKDNSVSAEEEKIYLKSFGAKMLSDEQLVSQQLFDPSQEAKAKLDVILAHLSRRGCIWTRASHRTRPSLRNPNPQKRPEFMIQGIFPEAFLNRCKRFQANDNLPMASDMDEIKEKERPLITTLQGISIEDDEAMQSEAKLAVVDALEGCSVRVSVEPYRGAGFFEEVQASAFLL